MATFHEPQDWVIIEQMHRFGTAAKHEGPEGGEESTDTLNPEVSRYLNLELGPATATLKHVGPLVNLADAASRCLASVLG